MATKIKLMRLGKMRAPYYRVVVADSRTKRDGRSIETIGKYHPKNDPSVIEIDNERALYWLRVGAQPTEAVAALLRVTGTWQEFKGLPAPPPMLVAAPKADKKAVFEDAARSAAGLKDESGATTPKAAKPAKKVAEKATKAKTAETPEVEAATETSAAEAPVAEAPAAEAPAEAPAAEAPVAETPAEPAAEAVTAEETSE